MNKELEELVKELDIKILEDKLVRMDLVRKDFKKQIKKLKISDSKINKMDVGINKDFFVLTYSNEKENRFHHHPVVYKKDKKNKITKITFIDSLKQERTHILDGEDKLKLFKKVAKKSGWKIKKKKTYTL